MKTDGAKAVLRRLIEGADVFVENYCLGAMAHYGVGYEGMAKTNPRLVYCSISGFGGTGPYAERGGFDLVAQGMSGLMSITGEGLVHPPVKVGGPCHRHHRRIARRPGYRGGAPQAGKHRSRPTGRHIAARGGDHAHFLAVGHPHGVG